MKFVLIYVNRTVLVYFPTYLFSGTEAISGLTKKESTIFSSVWGQTYAVIDFVSSPSEQSRVKSLLCKWVVHCLLAITGSH